MIRSIIFLQRHLLNCYRLCLFFFTLSLSCLYCCIFHDHAFCGETNTPENQTCNITLTPLFQEDIGKNMIQDPGFETVNREGMLKKWAWLRKNDGAQFSLTQDAVSGLYALRISSNEPLKNSTSELVSLEKIPLITDRFYTLSAYIKSNIKPHGWIGIGKRNRRLRIQFPDTSNQWIRISKTFLAPPLSKPNAIVIVSNGPGSIQIDNIKLEQGKQKTVYLEPVLKTSKLGVEFGNPVPSLWRTNVFEMDILIHTIFDLTEKKTISLKLTDTASGRTIVNHLIDTHSTDWSRISLSCKSDVVTKDSFSIKIYSGNISHEKEIDISLVKKFFNALDQAEKKVSKLQIMYNSMLNKGVQDSQVEAALTICNRFLKIAREKARKHLIKESVKDLNFLKQLCHRQTARIRDIRTGTIKAEFIPQDNLQNIVIRKGNFWSGDKPVMFVGALGYGELFHDLPSYKYYGFNIIGNDFDYVAKMWSVLRPNDVINKKAVERLESDLQQLHNMNLAIAFNPAIHTRLPKWAIEKFPDLIGGEELAAVYLNKTGYWQDDTRRGRYGTFFPFAIDSAATKKVISRYYKTVIPVLKGHKGFQMLWLMNEPFYHSRDRNYIELFHKYLKKIYHGDINILNSKWHTHYKHFDDVKKPYDHKFPGRYDWLNFHQGEVNKWFHWLSSEIKGIDKNTMLSNKPSAGNFFRPDSGIDFEDQAKLWDIIGFDAWRSPFSEKFAFNWSQATMMLDFFKSVAPEKPLADLEFHYVHEPSIPAGYVQAAFFQSYLHGLRMSNLWLWATGAFGLDYTHPGLTYTPWSQPEVAWETAKTAINIRRLSKFLAQFPGKAEVMIYYSKPSLFMDSENTRKIIRKTYELLNGLGAPVGFITDNMIRKGYLDQCKILFVPGCKFVTLPILQRIQQYVRNGGTLVTIGVDCFSKDQYNNNIPAKEFNVSSLNKRLVRLNPEELFLQRTINMLDKAFDNSGIERPIKVLKQNGDIAWPIEYRAFKDGNKITGYLIGLNKKSMNVEIIFSDAFHKPNILIKPLSIYSFNYSINR